MAREKIQIDLEAKDNASKEIDKVADAAENLEKQSPEVQIEADDQATAELEGVEGAAEDLDGTTAEVAATADDQASGDLEAVESAVEDLDGTTAEVEVEADTAGAEAGIGRFTGLLSGLKEQAAGVASSLGIGAGGIGLAGAAAAATAGVAAAGAAVFGAVNKFKDLALAAQELSIATRLSTEDASKWIALADDYNVEADTIEKTMIRLSRELGNNQDKFAKWGVEIARTNDGAVDVNGTFLNTIERMRTIESDAERAAIGQDLLGRSFLDLGPILDLTSNEIRGLLDATDESQVVTEKAAEQARKYDLALDELGDTLAGVSLEVGGKLAPALTTLTERAAETLAFFIDLPEAIGNFIGEIPGLKTALDQLFEQDDQGGGGGGFFDTLFSGIPDIIDQAKFHGKVIANAFTGAFADDLDDSVSEATEAANLFAEAEFGVGGAATTVAEAARAQADSLEELEDAEADAQAAADALTGAYEDQVTSIDVLIAKNLELVEGFQSFADTAIALEEANEGVTAATQDLNDTLADSESTAEDVEQAQDSLRDAVIRATDAELKNREAHAQANGTILTETQALDIQNESLFRQATQLTGPTRTAILAYIGNLNGIPTEVVSEIEALLDQGKVAEAEALLNSTSRARTSTVTADANVSAAEAALNELARERDALVHTVVSGPGGVRRFASGGTSSGGVALVGEEGPELVTLPAGAHVTPASQTAAKARALGAGGDTYYQTITINARNSDADVIRSIRRYNRRNGNFRIS